MATLTELLQETKTLKERIAKKRQRLVPYLCRTAVMVDRLTSSGGEEAHLASELQSIFDLEQRLIHVRSLIRQINSEVLVTVRGETKSVEDWITFKREIAPQLKQFYEGSLRHVDTLSAKYDTDRRTFSGNQGIDPRSFDMVYNFDVDGFRRSLEHLELVLSELDAKLSVANATTQVEFAPLEED